VKLKAKTIVLLYLYVCPTCQLGVDVSGMQMLLHQFSPASFIIFLNADNFQKKF